EVDREERDQRAGDLEVVRIEEPVRAEHPGVLAGGSELLTEELGLRSQLSRGVDDLRVAGYAGDERGEVGRIGLADRLAPHVETGVLEDLLYRVGETRAVAVLSVHDHDTSCVQPGANPARNAGALLVVVRHGAEEVALPRAVRRQARAGGRPRDVPEPAPSQRSRRDLHLLAPRRPDDGEDLRV